MRSRTCCISVLKRARQDLVGALERHALRLRDGRRQRPQEWRPTVVDFPTQQHGIVLVRGVVAVLHEHAAPVAELHRERDASVWTEPVHVLAALFPCRDAAGAAVPGEDLTLLEMDVDRMVPVTSVVDQLPDFARPEFRRRRYPTEIRGKFVSTVGANAPRAPEA